MSVSVQAADDPPWPVKPLHLIVPFAAGGPADVVARWLGIRLGERLGQTVLVESRPGAGGNIGMEAVARAAPDGYTWLLTSSVVAVNPVFFKMSVDPVNDLAPVVQLNRTDMALYARKDLPAQTPAEMLALLRSRPGGLSCGASGGGTRLGCELLQQQAGARVVVVNYRGSSPAMQDLIAGHVDVAVDLLSAGTAPLASGRIKLIARTGSSAAGHGVDMLPGFDLEAWQAVFAPVGVPPAVLQRLNREINRILASPETVNHLRELELEVVGGTPEALARKLRRDTERYRRIAHDAGLQPE